MEINDILVRKQDISLQLWESSFIINNGKLWLPVKSKRYGDTINNSSTQRESKRIEPREVDGGRFNGGFQDIL